MTRVRGFAVEGPDGTVYPSQAAASRALGVSKRTIRSHLRRFGNLSLIGDDVSGCGIPCRWRDRNYPSLTAVANASGRTVSTVIYHLSEYGNLDRLGVGPGGRRRKNGCMKPVVIGPYKWASRGALARDIGVSANTITDWLRPDAGPRKRERLMALVMQKSGAAEAAARARNEAEKARLDGRVSNAGRRAL